MMREKDRCSAVAMGLWKEAVEGGCGRVVKVVKVVKVV